MDEHVYPQDWGTGLDEQVDWNDAGAFAHLNDHPNLRGYASTGFEFDPDFDNDLLTISEGKAFVWEPTTETNDHRDDDGPDVKELGGALFVLQRDVSGDLTLTPDDTNYIYIGADQNDNDATDYYINTTETAPQRPYLFLGIVDTDAEEKYEFHRNPAETTRRHRVTGETHGQHYE